ncbi:MAG TPA: O-antigen ligase family protein [Longimicrobiales bacterium]|nr:O-antigen ligase family protein [Longimicrobiales bacterium]
MSHAAGPSATSSAASGVRIAQTPVVLALLLGAGVAGLSVLGPVQQTAVVLALGLGVPAAILFLARPYLGLAAYLLVLPLLVDRPIAAGFNGGELVTLGALLLGVASLWAVRERLGPTLRSLRPVVWPLVGLTLVSLVSLIANRVDDFGEILGALFKFLAFAGVAVLVHMHATDRRRAETMLRAVLMGALLVAIYAVVAYLLGWSYDEYYDWNRARGTFEHYNTMAGFMVLASMPTLAMASLTRRPPLRLLFAAAFLLQITAILLSLTLGAIASLLVGALLTLVFIARIGWGRILNGALLLCAGFAVVVAANPLLRDKLTQFDERIVDRFRTYAVGVSMFRDEFLFGFGSQQRALDALWFGDADYGLTDFGASSVLSHNSLLTMGVEKGFVGLILFALVIVGVLRLLFRHYAALRASTRWSLLYSGLMMGIFGFLFQNFSNNLVLHARLGILFFALVAIVVRLGELAEEDEPGEEAPA